MKNTKRILCAVLAMVMLLSVMLTGCSRPQVTFNKIPDTAATYGNGQKLTTGQYLAYLYLEFENLYFNQGLYQYASYGRDPWTQEFPYGDNNEKLLLSDYIIRATQDNIMRQIVLQQMLKDNGLKWFAEDEAELNKSLLSYKNDDSFQIIYPSLGVNTASIDLGFNYDSYAYALKNANLNERSVFFGLYGKGGKRAIAEKELKEYFEKNYLSYKMISIPLTDSNGKALDKEGKTYKLIMDRMNKYMEIYNEQDFDAAYEQYEKDQEEINNSKKEEATKTTTTTGTSGTNTTGTGTNGSGTTSGTTTTTTTTTTAADTTTSTANTTTTGTTSAEKEEEHEHEHEHNHRQDVDSAAEDYDQALKDAIVGKKDKDGKVEQEGVKVGECKIVNYKANGTTETVALIERLDINKDDKGEKPNTLFEDSKENIIYTKKYDEFNEEVKKAMAALAPQITFDEKVKAACKPEDFLEILSK